MGRRDAFLPQAVYGDTDLLSRRRWRQSQILADHFWSHFIKDDLPSLQTHQKWQRDTTGPAVSDVVMVMDPQLPRGPWPIGRVTHLLPSDHGHVRTVEVNIRGKPYVCCYWLGGQMVNTISNVTQ